MIQATKKMTYCLKGLSFKDMEIMGIGIEALDDDESINHRDKLSKIITKILNSDD